MFRILGTTVTRFWPVILAVWLCTLIILSWIAPSWQDVTQSGDVVFLPANSPSRQGDALLKDAFPEQYSGSSIVVVLTRTAGAISDDDRTFVDQALKPELEQLAGEKEGPGRLITRINTPSDSGAGSLLESIDQKATLVLIELSTAFLDERSNPLVTRVERLLERLNSEGRVPSGLDIAITGSAVAGRDLHRAEAQSVHAIERWTIVIVVVLLLLLYHAPLVALIPLITVFIAVQISLSLLALMAQADIIRLSNDVRIFVTVLAYGAGVDYCIFLIARYREELYNGMDRRTAVAHSIDRVGESVSASAATVIGGIGVLAFMEFGKIHEAGIVIPFALFIVLCAALTFAPAVLRLAGPLAFWPYHPEQRKQAKLARAPGILHRLLGVDYWKRIASALFRWPAPIWLATIALMTPFAIAAVMHYHDETYNPIGDLPDDAPGVRGTQALQKHFPAGLLGTFTVMLQDDQLDFGEIKGAGLIDALAKNLHKHRKELHLEDIRSVATPVGITAAAEDAEEQAGSWVGRRVLRARAARYYVSQKSPLTGHVTRLDLVLTHDPFTTTAIDDIDRIQSELPNLMPQELRTAKLHITGATAAIRDLADVKQRDQNRVEIFVPLVIFVLLWIVLRRAAISIYLVLSVLFSYLTTMGATFVLFWHLYPEQFHGLDWKVPIFLFTILVAVGEDYNIFLIGRIREEQCAHGPSRGLMLALVRTGRVISACGIIMAGTFASLFSGTLLEMKELAFALSFGILLDTLVVRPILVPAFLFLLQRRLGKFGRFFALGCEQPPARTKFS